jgi:hypothetical protein
MTFSSSDSDSGLDGIPELDAADPPPPDPAPNSAAVVAPPAATAKSSEPPPRPPPALNRSAVVRRSPKATIKGWRFYFDMPGTAASPFHSKALARHPGNATLPVTRDADVHMRGAAEFTIRSDRPCKAFSLVRADGAEALASLEMLKEEVRGIRLPQYSRITVGGGLGLAVAGFVSQRPRMSNQGFWFLDFHNRFTIPSHRNAIFLADTPARDGAEMFAVRQIEKDALQFDLFVELPELLIFFVGVAAFLAKGR